MKQTMKFGGLAGCIGYTGIMEKKMKLLSTLGYTLGSYRGFNMEHPNNGESNGKENEKMQNELEKLRSLKRCI